MNLVDSHAHLEFDDYEDDIAQVLERAWVNSVRAILSVSCINPENDGRELLALIEEFSGRDVRLFSAFGVHPHDAVSWNEEIKERIRDLSLSSHGLALGEIGLDFYYNHSPADIQEKAFRQQVELAADLGLPVIIHSRDAEAETLRILEEYYRGESGRSPGVVHCYTGSIETAEKILDLGFFLSFGGIVTFKKSDVMREVIKRVPLESILIETDSPFLAPVPFRGKRNEPAHVKVVAEKIAEIKQVPLSEAASVTTGNFYRLFPRALSVD